MKLPELLVTPTSTSDIPLLAKAGANAILIGEEKFGLRLAGEFPLEAMKEATKFATQYGLKVYVAVNGIFHNEKLEALKSYMEQVAALNVDAFVFGDPSVVMLAKSLEIHIPLHWNTETTATNWFACNYWGKKGAKRAVLARELSLEAVIETKERAEVEIEVQIHGMTTMFQSKRSLVENYFSYQGKTGKHKQRDMLLYDGERDNRYPIFEDGNGTHIMSPNDICMIADLPELLDAEIDSFKIDGLLKSTDYLVTITKFYREAMELYKESPKLYEEQKETFVQKIEAIQPENRPLDTGFFYKETVY